MLQIHRLRSGEKADSRAMNCFSDFSISNICVQNRRFSTLPGDVTYLIIDKLTTFQTKKPTNQHAKGHAYARIRQTIALQYTINSLGGSFHRLKHSIGWRTDSTDSMFVESTKIKWIVFPFLEKE